MIRISHRGNLNGPNLADENNPELIENVINKNYDVEIDLWVIDEKLYLGHDLPVYEINKSFLVRNSKSLWVHCKNHQALLLCNTKLDFLNYFFHDNDSYTLTSKGFIWCHPKSFVLKKSIFVMPEKVIEPKFFRREIDNSCLGICSDYISFFE